MMLICDDFQLVNQFSERNDNSHKEIITFEIHEVVAQRLALLALGRAAERRPNRKSYQRRKMLENGARIPSVQCTLC
jgi:hypothetical protein